MRWRHGMRPIAAEANRWCKRFSRSSSSVRWRKPICLRDDAGTRGRSGARPCAQERRRGRLGLNTDTCGGWTRPGKTHSRCGPSQQRCCPSARMSHEDLRMPPPWVATANRSGCRGGDSRPHADGEPGRGVAGRRQDRWRDRLGDGPSRKHHPYARAPHLHNARNHPASGSCAARAVGGGRAPHSALKATGALWRRGARLSIINERTVASAPWMRADM